MRRRSPASWSPPKPWSPNDRRRKPHRLALLEGWAAWAAAWVTWTSSPGARGSWFGPMAPRLSSDLERYPATDAFERKSHGRSGTSDSGFRYVRVTDRPSYRSFHTGGAPRMSPEGPGNSARTSRAENYVR